MAGASWAILLHFLLLLLYIALLGVCITGVEHNLVVPLGRKTSELSVSVVIVTQAIVVVSPVLHGCVLARPYFVFLFTLGLSCHYSGSGTTVLDEIELLD